ncbi:hypothetical protein FDENT_1748 [Fusarium denticulatum]|uniref:Uncharacterized protein n=1 Tax=Fusarium denticulatum TaxID=48507 RepID=A0A8H5XHD2_9HYPO|nr:hypothetical protein FDENT_1748 [Fusarium denticulatum]
MQTYRPLHMKADIDPAGALAANASFHRPQSEKLPQLLKDIEAPRGLPSRQHSSHSLVITDPTTNPTDHDLTATVGSKDTSARETREANISSALYPSLGHRPLLVTSNCLALVIMVIMPFECQTEDHCRSEHQLRFLSKSGPGRLVGDHQQLVFFPQDYKLLRFTPAAYLDNITYCFDYY